VHLSRKKKDGNRRLKLIQGKSPKFRCTLRTGIEGEGSDWREPSRERKRDLRHLCHDKTIRWEAGSGRIPYEEKKEKHS